MTKRIIVVAIVVAACLLMVAPAFAWNGLRQTYTTADGCQICHSGTAGIPAVYPEWAESKHAENEAYSGVAARLPYASVCQGCHTSNFAPSKLTPVPTATTTQYAAPFATPPVATATAVAWGASPSAITAPQSTGEAAWSEGFIGCSSCHYGANMAGIGESAGTDPADTAHTAPYGEMANADICGACHSRYSYTVGTYAVGTVSHLKLDGAGLPIPLPTASQTSLIQPQMAIGYPELSVGAAVPLSSYLNIPYPGWTPTPTATSAGTYNAPGLMKYWKVGGQDTMWQLAGHDGSAAQYPEWASEGHAAALTGLTSQPFWGFLPEASKQECLECHSADFRILKEAGEPVTSADVKYGITCVGCHTPHDAGTAVGAWDEEFDTQLITDSAKTLCVTCHNGEIPAGTTASPGAEIHHPMKEMMDGYGAIDVASFPSVHKGKCVQCHMPPTSYSRGSVQLGGNHTFNIIEPEVAFEAAPIPIATANATATATPDPSRTVVTKTTTLTQDSMPYSACSTCHNNNQKPTPVPVATVTTSAVPSVSPTAVSVTITQNVANQGDKALWMQDTIEQRQEWTVAKIAELHAALNAAAVRLGHADEAAAQEALVAIPAADRTASQTNFLKAFTNVGYVESEGSFGIHNWDYSRAIVNTALFEANSVEATPAPTPWTVSFKASKKSVKKNTKIKYSGTVSPAASLAWGGAKVTIQRKTKGVWKTWKTATCNGSGSYSLTVKMTKKGTYYLRAMMPANSKQLAGNSAQIKIKVKVKK